jgi:hypothetical protein
VDSGDLIIVNETKYKSDEKQMNNQESLLSTYRKANLVREDTLAGTLPEIALLLTNLNSYQFRSNICKERMSYKLTSFVALLASKSGKELNWLNIKFLRGLIRL